MGKLIPFWMAVLAVLTVGLKVRMIYGIVPVGHSLMISEFPSTYLLAIPRLGLLMSTYAQTQALFGFAAFFYG